MKRGGKFDKAAFVRYTNQSAANLGQAESSVLMVLNNNFTIFDLNLSFSKQAYGLGVKLVFHLQHTSGK
jgi:hypothetical protein